MTPQYIQKTSLTLLYVAFWKNSIVVGQICNNFEKNRAFYDKSMKLGT